MKLNDMFLIISVYYLIFLVSTSCLRADDKVVVHVFDVGQGDAILIDVRGSKILIDGGANFEVDYELNKIMPFWNCELFALILTHPHYDHVAGLNKVLDRCKVGRIMFNDVDYSSMEFDFFKDRVSTLNKKKAIDGDVFRINNATFYILWPTQTFLDSRIENVNNMSVVVFMDYGNFEAMFLGDAEKDVLSKIDLSNISHLIDGKLDLLKVAHHGAKNGTYEDFINTLDPETCVISVGSDNRYGHPHPETLDFLNEIGCNVLRTDEVGDVVFRVD